jgi:hypothetical protein
VQERRRTGRLDRERRRGAFDCVGFVHKCQFRWQDVFPLLARIREDVIDRNKPGVGAVS